MNPSESGTAMERYHYIWVFKSLFILAGMVAQFIGFLYIYNGRSDKFTIDTNLRNIGIGLTARSASMLVIVFGAILTISHSLVPHPFEYLIEDEVSSYIPRPAFIDIARATVSCYGVFILFFGVWMSEN